MKFFKRSVPKDPGEADKLQLRILRQQVQANETNLLLNMITQKEYDDTLKRLNAQLTALEEKYGIEDKR